MIALFLKKKPDGEKKCENCVHLVRYMDGTFCDRRAIWRLRSDKACNLVSEKK